MPSGIQDPASLENLHDIITPGPVPWWPPAPGWYVLGTLLFVAAGLFVVKTVLHWRKNRYRREALALLAEIEQSSRDTDTRSGAIFQLAELLKRVALAAWPREAVASLTGRRWLEFLRATGLKTPFSDDLSLALCDVAYCRKMCSQLSPAQVERLFTAARDWITTHDASISVTGVPAERNR